MRRVELPRLERLEPLGQASLGDLRESVESARRASHQIEQMAAAADDEAQAVVVRGPSLAEQALTQTQVILAQLFVVLVLMCAVTVLTETLPANVQASTAVATGD